MPSSDKDQGRRLKIVFAKIIPKTECPTSPLIRIRSMKVTPEVKRLELVVLRRYPRRLVNSNNFTGSVAAACGRDETGIVGIVLWGDQVNTVNTGDIIRIENGWCRSRSGELVVSTGKNGTLSILDR